MHNLRMILTATLLACLAACNTSNPPETPVADAPPMMTYYMVADNGMTVRFSGRTLHIKQREITTDHGGSLKLPANWGTLEFKDTRTTIDVYLDGVLSGNLPK